MLAIAKNGGLKSIMVQRNIVRAMSELVQPGHGDSVTFAVQDTARVASLNRPKKLNALNQEMCSSMFDVFEEYAKSKAADLLILKSTNQPRSFCAGGDVASVADYNLNNEFEKSDSLFSAEYSLNFQLATFPKPVLSIMDGITMGGGVGLSIHTPFRIATENTKWAMPEMDIGFFPDVGTTFALPRIITIANREAQMALYLVLTGEVLNGPDVYLLGLASHYVPHENLVDLQLRLGELHAGEMGKTASFFDSVNDTVEEFSTALPKDYQFRYSNEQLDVIEKCFSINGNDSIKSIMTKLDNYQGTPEGQQFAASTKDKLKTKSYPSMQVALRLMQENSKDNLQSALKRDLYTAANFSREATNESPLVEFSQATKHKLIDKQRSQYNWQHKTELPTSAITQLISPRPSIPLTLWANASNVTWKSYPFHSKYQLPTEAIIRSHLDDIVQPEGPTLMKQIVKSFSTRLPAKVGTEYLLNVLCSRIYNIDKDTNSLTRKD